jgi:hypothetical protein
MTSMKKAIMTTVQVLVTVGILCWVFHDPVQRGRMWEALRHAKPGWLFLGFLCYAVVEILAAGRWYLLLRVQGVRLPLWRVVMLFMLGIFFNMFMPGGTGGDVLKIYFLLREVPEKDKKAKSVLAVLMDRLIGLLALIIISATIIGLQYNWLKTTAISRHLTWVMLMLLVSALGAIMFSFVVSGFGLARKLPKRMPMRDVMIDLAVAYNAYARAWPASLLALVGSFGVHFSTFFLFVCAARALSVPISTGALLTVMPIILTLASLPISVGGTGVREMLFVNLLGPLCGISQPVATMLSLTGFMLNAAWGLIGGLIYLLYRPSEHAKMRDIEQQVHAMEHEIAEEDGGGGHGDGANGQRAMVTAAYSLSLDGRVLERRMPEADIDAVLCGSDKEECNGAAARVLVSGTGDLDAAARFFDEARGPVIVYSTDRMPGSVRAALEKKGNVQVQIRDAGEWPMCEVLADLRATHGKRRVAFAGGPELFRGLVASGLVDELCVIFKPVIVGGKDAPTMTGLEQDYLPHGVALELVGIEQRGDECLARYRVQGQGS